MELNTIYHGDCLELLKHIPDNSIDVIWTDPPYGNNNNNNGDLIHRCEKAIPSRRKKGDTGADEYEARPILNDSPEDFARVVPAMLDEAARVLKKESCCCCCCCCGGGGPKVMFAQVATWIDQKLQFDQAVVWDKGGLGMGWKYRRNYEFVMVAHRKGGKMKWETERNDAITANVVRVGKIIPQAEDHPTPKPLALVEHFLRLHGKPGDIVLDPFCGAGTTCLAAKKLGMNYIGIELDPHWANVARMRVAEHDGMFFDDSGQEVAKQNALF